MTVAEYLARWYRDYAVPNVRSRSAEGYEGIIRNHLVPRLGRIRLTSLTPAHIQQYYAWALREGRRNRKPGGLSAKTVIQHHRVLSEALKHAVRWGLLPRNVAQAVDPPPAKRHNITPMDKFEALKLLETARDTVYFPFIDLALYTGLRRSELLGLRWWNVDLEFATLSVVQVMHRLKGGQLVFEEPKSAKSRRQVSLSPTAVLVMRGHRERQEADKERLGEPMEPDGLVFCHQDSSPMRPNSVSHAFTRIARKTGLEGVRFHDMRHTHATLLLRRGVHPKIVQERLGHATISMTLDIYSHVTPGLQKAAAMEFEDELEERLVPDG